MSPSPKPTTERDFEDAIESWLLDHGGYTKAPAGQFDAKLGLDPMTMLAFLQQTQEATWKALCATYGSEVETRVVERIATECDAHGLLQVIRHGIRDRGQHLKLAYFRPPTSLNPETERLYNQNRLTVMRQVRYDLDSEKSIDLLLSVNGLPIATVELKNAMSGQRSLNAILQYIKDRQPSPKTKLLEFKKRALVHFAVDTDEAYMATRLSGKSTYFLPFNTGDHGGKGNPADHSYATGYKTGYLWEQVWTKDSWLDIIHRFIHLQVEELKDPATGKTKRTETLIFPRYHQLDATRKTLADTKAHGVGRNYLIQHSAGSGKTNTISWTAHQLASLHDDRDQSIFDSVVVISDRRNLDKQLQDNIYQMEHKRGVVARIDEDRNSADLAEELNKGTKIIITTLQKFSFLLDKVQDLKGRKFAVIADEAHSSQGGRAAGHLRGVLGGSITEQGSTEEERLDAAERADQGAGPVETLEDRIVAEARSRGPQGNISFYAFTATPKPKTLELFGCPDSSGKPQPFHLYSMRQAIEEKFIFDVLAHYTTYKTYYKLAKAIEDDPEVDERKAKRSIARFVSLHKYNLAQKTEVMVEHFRRFTRQKVGGRAKAMVVTRSRLHAVRYYQAFTKYLADKGYTDLGILVAFSGTVEDDKVPGSSYTEPGLNGFSEAMLPRMLATPDYHVLIVAEKYQTGFDQPLLHTMYVDKKLDGLHAVQTLSRLNRTMRGKTDTFVLDFVNEAEDIREAFKPYYEHTELDEVTDPNQIYTLLIRLKASPVLRVEDVEGFAEVYFKPRAQQTKRDHGKLNQWIDPSVARFREEYLDRLAPGGEEFFTEEGEEFRSSLQGFVRLYGFLSQIIDWQDPELEKLYAFGRYLLTKLPQRGGGGLLRLDDEVALDSYRLEKTHEGTASLDPGDTRVVYVAKEVGTGRVQEEAKAPLSEILETFNERFGTDWTDEDMLVLEQIKGDMVSDEVLAQQARVNTKDQFRPVFKQRMMAAFLNRRERNERLVVDFMASEDMRDAILGWLVDEVYSSAQTSNG